MEYRKDFLETLRAHAAAEGDFEASSFVRLAALKLMESEEFDDYEDCFYEGTGRRNRKLSVNGYSFNEVDDSVVLLVSHYSGGDESDTLTQTEIDRLFDRLKAFGEEALSGKLHVNLEESSPAYSLAYEIARRSKEIRCLKLYLVSDSVLSNRVKVLDAGMLSGISIEYHVWDIARLHRVYQSKTGREDLIIDFREFNGDGIQCLEASQSEGGEYKAYLCVIPGEVVANIYHRFGSRLLEGNVRAFLSTKVKVNKSIRNTILKEPDMFFAYNNGIAATATDAVVEKTAAGMKLMQVTDLQIVNGGQTTASLLMAKIKDKASLSDIYVQMKLSVVSPFKAETIIPEISRNANHQNKVSEVDFFSNHPFHIRFESFARRLWAPAIGGAQYETHWFYERARGQYLNEHAQMTPSDQKKFKVQNPKEQMLTKTDLAKYHNTWRESPHLVSLGAQKNFRYFAEWITEKWDAGDAEFNEQYFKDSISMAILYKYTERLVSRQPWYSGGFRANIVPYSLSKLVQLIKSSFSGMSLDLHSIWSSQEVPNALEGQMINITKAVHDVIFSPDPGFQNIGEWCKKERCWTRIKNMEVPIDLRLESVLVDAGEQNERKRSSRNQQKVDNGIGTQIQVVTYGADNWEQLRVWAVARRLLNAEEDKLLRVAARISSGVMPTDKQCEKLLQIKKRVYDEGYIDIA